MVKGRWYKNCGYDGNFICKFDYINSHTAYISEYINTYKGSYYKDKGSITMINVTECFIEEIAHYLPKDHPDLLELKRVHEVW